uniref:Thiosulfate sulfurtransferase n=1 Tax=Mycobacterium sp. (strain KMS) TaxID=189918 RepID=A1UMD8_MYCSK
MTRADVLITVGELAELLAAGRPVTLLDVRWQLAQPDGRDDYAAGHLPGAVYVSLEDELSDHTVTGRGRHPLPSGAAVQAAARRWGVRDGVPTVVYDDWNRAGSARAWWVLTAAGVADVRILDGGLAAWTAAGGALEAGAVTASPGDVTVLHDDLYRGALPTLTAGEVATFDGVLLDSRAPERFRGEVEPVDPVAGHIPGAENVPSTALLTADGTFRPAADLAGVLDRVRGGDAGVYCGSGVTAAVVVAALRAGGVQTRLFPGSWSQWCADPVRPVATGD